MSGKRAIYLDSSALVKLVVREPESSALRGYLVRRRLVVSSALSRTEVARALLPFGTEARARGRDVLGRVELLRISDRVLDTAGRLPPADLRSLDAIHLASAEMIGSDLASFITYDDRVEAMAHVRGLQVLKPA